MPLFYYFGFYELTITKRGVSKKTPKSKDAFRGANNLHETLKCIECLTASISDIFCIVSY